MEYVKPAVINPATVIRQSAAMARVADPAV